MSCYHDKAPVYVRPMQRLCLLESYKRHFGREFKRYHGHSIKVRYWWDHQGMSTTVRLRGAIPWRVKGENSR